MTKINGERRIIDEATVKTSREGFSKYLADKDHSIPVVFETGTHCRLRTEHTALSCTEPTATFASVRLNSIMRGIFRWKIPLPQRITAM